MSRSKLYALARSLTLLASVGAPCLAHAADLLPPPPPPPPPLPAPIEVGGGWYLRGDVGASIYDRARYSAVDAHPEYHFFGDDVGGGAFAGVGVGYQVNDFFRFDVTGEYRFSTGLRTNTYNQISYNYDCGGGTVHKDGHYAGSYTCNRSGSGTNYDTIHGRYSAAVVLANAYVDLGTWYGVTPFVGGGVGAAFNHLSGFTDSSVTKSNYVDTIHYTSDCGCTETTTKHGSLSEASGGTFKDKTTTSFAWALHAGLAYKVTDRFAVELAYRYLNLGHAATGVLNCFCGGEQGGLKVKNLEAHDVKIGFRYLLGGFVAAPLPPLAPAYEPAPGPIVRKY